MLIFAIALFKRELLIQRESFRLIFGASVLLFLIGVALHFTSVGRDSTHGALLTPLLSLGLYRLSRGFFVRRYGREPRDTWFNWAEGMGADRLFNILYFVSALWLLMILTIVMWEMAERGW